MQEGISYLAGVELPAVIVDVVKGEPGLGNIASEQSDYAALVKGGHGDNRNLVLAPTSVQEMAEPTMVVFDLADQYRNPAVVLADGFTGQMMEPIDFEYREFVAPEKTWAVKETAETRNNLITSIYLEADDLKRTNARWRPSISGHKMRKGVSRNFTGQAMQMCWCWDTELSRVCCAPPWTRRVKKV
jgi:pyruvate/2-oxoacid:ferredoxin oxidoreductase alpha subunit